MKKTLTLLVAGLLLSTSCQSQVADGQKEVTKTIENFAAFADKQDTEALDGLLT